jgi:NADPH:quinone reductase-like Zn-dependent oxidoreductase
MQGKTMKAIQLPAYQGNIIRALRSLKIVENTLPSLLDDEVMVEVSAAPANPSDLAFIQGGYNVRKPVPSIPGFEGTGKIVFVGKDEHARKLLGKRVSFFSQSERGGSWASYTPVKAVDCLELDERIPYEQAACFSVNPFTAYAMVELAKNNGSKAIMQNAASGQVGRFINRLAGMSGIAVINIVRKEEQLQKMADAGFENVLWAQDEEFLPRLKQLATALDARLAFDAAGGMQSGHILSCMPEGSTLYLYGALAGRTLSEIPASDVIFKKKTITGFNMNEWKAKLPKDEFEKISRRLQQLFISGDLKTDIQGRFPLADYEKGLMQYIRGMSDGKILLIP